MEWSDLLAFNKSIEIQDNADARHGRRRAYRQSGRDDLAALDYQRIREIDPNYASAYVNEKPETIAFRIWLGLLFEYLIFETQLRVAQPELCQATTGTNNSAFLFQKKKLHIASFAICCHLINR